MTMQIYRGWPFDGALSDNAKPKDGENIIAGMAIKKDANGELVKADGTQGEKAFFALENQDDMAVMGAQKMAYVVGNAIVLTDQYESGPTYANGTELQVRSGADAGTLTEHAGGTAPVFGWCDGFITRDGINFLKVKLEE